ncbi:MAG: transposase [Clostridiales bacterium]|nr:transposase [Clostridiales bacterium]
MKEELFLDFDPANAADVPACLDTYVRYFNFDRPAAALGYKSPVQFRAERGF